VPSPNLRPTAIDEPSNVRAPATTSGPLVRRTSIGSVLVAVLVIAGGLIATSLHQPQPSNPPAGAVGLGPPPPTEPAGSWTAVIGSPGSSEGMEGSADATDSSAPTVRPTEWRTQVPDSGCHPYVRACDPSIMPLYAYVGVLAEGYGIGKVTVVAAGHTYSCSVYTRPAENCYWDIPPGLQVTATVSTQPGSICQVFYLLWEDYSSPVTHDDCSPITFTTQDQDAQLTADFEPAPTAPPATPTNPAATPAATPTPTATPVDTPAPS
jgi:hypothetical protein